MVTFKSSLLPFTLNVYSFLCKKRPVSLRVPRESVNLSADLCLSYLHPMGFECFFNSSFLNCLFDGVTFHCLQNEVQSA